MVEALLPPTARLPQFVPKERELMSVFFCVSVLFCPTVSATFIPFFFVSPELKYLLN